jgi:hypothetical protein
MVGIFMNVDLIKFVDDDNYITIYSKKDWWQYIHYIHKSEKFDIFLIDHYHERIVQPYDDLTDIISTILNHPHQAKVLDMMRYMKGKKK